MVWWDVVCGGVVWCGVGCGVVWCGVVRCGAFWGDLARCGAGWCGMKPDAAYSVVVLGVGVHQRRSQSDDHLS